jgi:outer membrane protein OmpA-like peptidoglycan-associated protein
MVNIMRGAAAAFALLALSSWHTAPAAEQRMNLLTLAAGSVLLENTQAYSGAWAALYVLDGDPKTGWSSAQRNINGNAFLIELPQTYRLDAFGIVNAAQEPQYAGISARHIEIWTSVQSPTAGFTKVATVEAARGTRSEMALPNVQARWLRLVVADNWGHADYTEFMDLEAYGTPVGAAPQQASLTGIYDSNYGTLRLVQQGTSVRGCYRGNAGTVQGATDGRMLNVEWRSTGSSSHGSAVMVLTSSGDFLNGVWYENGSVQGIWFGKRVMQGQPCTAPGISALASDLRSTGRAVLYGIRFATNSADITPESETVLNDVVAVTKTDTQLRLRIEGHTDSTNDDAFNLALSQRRADAVVAWLVAHGVPRPRLEAQGLGESKPVAGNDTLHGRALNRRVEIATIGN